MLLQNVISIIYICTHFNFLIYGISIEIVIFCNYNCIYTNTNFENVSRNIIHIYVIYIMQYKLVEYIY